MSVQTTTDVWLFFRRNPSSEFHIICKNKWQDVQKIETRHLVGFGKEFYGDPCHCLGKQK